MRGRPRMAPRCGSPNSASACDSVVRAVWLGHCSVPRAAQHRVGGPLAPGDGFDHGGQAMQERGSGREIAMVVSVLVLVAVGTMTTYWLRSSSVEAAGQTVPAVATPAAVRVAAP